MNISKESILKYKKISIYLNILTFVISFYFAAFSGEHRNDSISHSNKLDTIKNNSKKTKQTERDSLWDGTSGADSTCELHHCKMFKGTVTASTVVDTNRLRRYISLLERMGYDPFPHSEKLGGGPKIMYLCPKCIKASKEYFINKKYPVDPKGQGRL